ncbi:MAG: DUF5685 family protein [Clostridiales bacterium]|nr:DUF5685 family protein [Clostridiales bacterium]
MIGYVRIYKPELKIKEYEFYRGVYCSLCKRLCRDYSPLACLLLSYDFTVAALVKIALSENECSFKKSRCHFNPTKKCLNCNGSVDLGDIAAAVIITLYYKLLDNLKDKGLWRKIAAAVCFLPIWLMHIKAKRISPEIEEIIFNGMQLQAKTENEKDVSADAAAHPSAHTLGSIFALVDESRRDTLYRLGYMLARFVYLSDAADDYKDDSKKRNFNPYIIKFGPYTPENRQKVNKSYEWSFNLIQVEITKAFEELNVKRCGELLNNIFTLGIKAKMENIISEKGVKND